MEMYGLLVGHRPYRLVLAAPLHRLNVDTRERVANGARRPCRG